MSRRIAFCLLLFSLGCDSQRNARLKKGEVVAIAAKAARDDGSEPIRYTNREPLYASGKWIVRFEMVPPQVVGHEFDVFVEDATGETTIERGD
jgi:hypothetical protein